MSMAYSSSFWQCWAFFPGWLVKGWVGRKVGGLGGSGEIKIKDNLGQAKNQVKSVIGYKTKWAASAQ